jgi:hypothetical protein
MPHHLHFGGFEGLRQKGWTAATIAMIEVSFLLSGTTGTTTGQGDNQTIKLNIPNHTQFLPKEFMKQYPEIVDDTTKRFLDTLSRVADGVGQMLKIEETWVSQHLYSFGKGTSRWVSTTWMPEKSSKNIRRHK